MKTLSECKAAGIPVYQFGSEELHKMHEASLGPAIPAGRRPEGPWRYCNGAWESSGSYMVTTRRYEDHVDNRQYVVDHGHGHYTLNTLHAGQVCPAMRDLLPH